MRQNFAVRFPDNDEPCYFPRCGCPRQKIFQAKTRVLKRNRKRVSAAVYHGKVIRGETSGPGTWRGLKERSTLNSSTRSTACTIASESRCRGRHSTISGVCRSGGPERDTRRVKSSRRSRSTALRSGGPKVGAKSREAIGRDNRVRSIGTVGRCSGVSLRPGPGLIWLPLH